nr:Uncharacterised protein [Streptococcus thermophilus]
MSASFREDGVFGNFYAQPISVNPKRPNAARLWVEWLNSDEGAEQYALGGAIPSRFTKLAEEGKLSDEAMEKLPDRPSWRRCRSRPLSRATRPTRSSLLSGRRGSVTNV